MTEPEELDEDLFADLYDADEPATKPAPEDTTDYNTPNGNETASGAVNNADNITKDEEPPDIKAITEGNNFSDNYDASMNAVYSNQDAFDGQTNQFHNGDIEIEHHNIGIKEDGKMFIGGLNWETDDESLKNYFSTFGEVQECTVMRDGASGRSRGFGFLTFKDPKVVNVVMVKEHFLDGKIIDPKRAIPREEQERTSKIFVGGVSQDANDAIFREYFMQFGRVVDATLMIDKETGRPRGFGFVTFDSEQAVDNALNGDLRILGKPIDIKRAQPRGNMREEDELAGRRGGGGRAGRGGGFRNDRDNFDNNSNGMNGQMQQMQGGQGNGGQGMYPNGMTPSMMAQYFQKMQQYIMTMNQQMAAMQGGAMGGMNPMMMMQMQQRMQQMQQQQQQVQAQAQNSQANHQQQQQQQPPNGSASPNGSAMDSQQNQMNPAMVQQMQQMQQMQQQMAATQQQQQQGGVGGGGGSQPGSVPPAITNPFPPPTGPSGRGTPGFNAQEQMMFEQQKYEQQQARQAQQAAMYTGGQAGWEGMYDDVPPPQQPQQQPARIGVASGGGGGGGGYGGHHGGGNFHRGGRGRGGFRGGFQNRQHQPQQPQPQQAGGGEQAPGGGTPPPNAPTGPKNAGRPGANYRGGGRGAHRGFHPYARG